jgi:zinc protease
VTPTLARGLTPARAVLGNGAVVIAQETSTTPAVAIHASLFFGSADEPHDLPGLAYFTGRMLDRGTESRPADVLAEELDDRGVSLRTGTTRHTLSVTTTCLSEEFDDVLAIVADVLRRPTFAEREIEKRRAEIATSIRQDDDNPAVRCGEALFELMYGADHPYATRAKGTLASVARIDRPAIAGFYARHARPAVFSLVVVGCVPRQQVLDRAAAELGGWAGGRSTPIVVPAPLPALMRRERHIVMPGKSQTDIAYGFTAVSRLDPRFYAYWMMNNVLGQFGLGGRLADNIRERQGMAYYAFSSFDGNVGEAPLVVRAGVDPRNVRRAVAAIDAEVRALGADGPTAGELEETRASLIGSIPRMLETNESIAGFLQATEQYGLGLDYDQRLPSLLRAVSIDDVRAAGADVLRPDRAAVAVAGPAESAA